jgi:hypothetical protein
MTLISQQITKAVKAGTNRVSDCAESNAVRHIVNKSKVMEVNHE